jgi:hypothetical protein
LSYWSLSGAVDPNVSFITTGAAVSKMLFTYAGNAANNALYIYDIADPSSTVQVFSAGTAPGTAVEVIVPWAAYGYELSGPGGTFYSTTGPSGTSTGNFAFLAPGTPSYDTVTGGYISNVWYVGVEDLPTTLYPGGCDLDYQDMVFSVTTIPPSGVVPLPSSLLLLGSGIFGMALRGWRRAMTRPQ